jgi:hypothetical protein
MLAILAPHITNQVSLLLYSFSPYVHPTNLVPRGSTSMSGYPLFGQNAATLQRDESISGLASKRILLMQQSYIAPDWSALG